MASVILGGFYYASEAKKLKHAEEQQQLKEEKARFLLSNCLDLAKESLIEQWYAECNVQGLLTGQCLLIRDMTLEEFAKKNHLNPEDIETPALRGKFSVEVLVKKEKCACRLPIIHADRLTKVIKDRKDECYKKYPQN